MERVSWCRHTNCSFQFIVESALSLVYSVPFGLSASGAVVVGDKTNSKDARSTLAVDLISPYPNFILAHRIADKSSADIGFLGGAN